MTKFHITDDGNPRKCVAKPGNCSYGAEAAHYDSRESAREAFEEKNTSKTVAASKTLTLAQAKRENEIKGANRAKKSKLNSPVSPTVAHGYAETTDEDGNVTKRVRLIDRKPENHPSGTPAIIKYEKHSVEEIFYNAGKLHDGSGDMPSRIRKFHSGSNAGLVITQRGFRAKGRSNGSFLGQDSPDGQPARVLEYSDGSKEVEHCTDGLRQDTADGKPAITKYSADGTVTEAHMIGGKQHDAADGSPSVVVKRPDGTVAKTVRYYSGRPWDGANGEPALVEYDESGEISKQVHYSLGEHDGRWVELRSEEGPIPHGIKRGELSWMTIKPSVRFDANANQYEVPKG